MANTMLCMGWYVPDAPPAHLAPYLACSWTAEPNGKHMLVPDGCVDLLWTSRGELWVCGPETRAWRFELPDGTTAVGVRFRPGIPSVVFDVDSSTLRDRRVALRDLVDAGAEIALMNDISHAGTATARLSAIELFVGRLARASETGRRRTVAHVNRRFAETVVNALTDDSRISQARLADRLGMTARHLHRRSLTVFGYGTTHLGRLLRFQRFLAFAELDRAAAPIARLAVEAGFSDHAHLARDCRNLTGLAPSAFLAEYFPTFPDMSDPYKTGRTFAVNMAG